MKLGCFEIRQGADLLHVGTLTVRDLKDETKVRADTWTRDNPEGYQREPTESRVAAFARYISKAKGATPLSILLSLRSPASFTKVSGEYGILEIPDDETLWIVDGQHRIAGFRRIAKEDPSIDDYPVPVVIMQSAQDRKKFSELESRYEEAKQFVIVNRTQKGVRSDLGERFLARLAEREAPEVVEQLPAAVTRGIEWIPKAIEVAEYLSENGDVWRNRIRLPNEPKGTTLVSQKSFTDSIRLIILDPKFSPYSSKELATMLDRYWSGVSRCCPEAFSNPNGHVIQRTTGVFVLHRVFPEVATMVAAGGNKLTADIFEKWLKRVRPGFTSGFWTSTGEAGLAGTGSKSFALLSSRLLESIRKAKLGEKGPELRAYAL